MKTLRRTVLLLFATGALGTWMLTSRATNQDFDSSFTLEWLDTRFQDGELINSSSDTFATRGDGSTVLVHSYRHADGTKVELRQITDIATSRQILTHSLAESVSTMRLEQNAAAAMATNSPNCGQPFTAPTKKVLGYKVVRVAINIAEQGMPSIDRWVAPALRCAILRSTVTRDGKAIYVRQAKRISIGEPDASLFAIPSHFKEMSPQQILQTVGHKLDDNTPVLTSEIEKQMQQKYLSKRIVVR
jgi:hypothetical protein